MNPQLPQPCERAFLEQFLKAEAMVLWMVRSAQRQKVPPEALLFLRRHEEEEARHLAHFEQMLGTVSHGKTVLPRVPNEWRILAVHLYGYEALGLEFAKLLVGVRPDLDSVLKDEETHVAFFENEVRRILLPAGPSAAGARDTARAWRRRLPRTLERYLHYEDLAPFREDLQRSILAAIDARFAASGLCPQCGSVGLRKGPTDCG